MGELFKWVGNVVLWCAPPKDEGVTPAGNAWRWKTFVGVLALYAIVAFHILWICNGLTGYGLVGAAFASDLDPIKQQLVDMRKGTIQIALAADQLKICRLSSAALKPDAPKDLLQAALDAAQAEFQRHFNEYTQLNGGRPFVVQPCSVILIAGGQ